MENKFYLIYRDSLDDACSIAGFVFGTEDDVASCCEELNKDAKYEWDRYYCEDLKCLNPEKLNAFILKEQNHEGQ